MQTTTGIPRGASAGNAPCGIPGDILAATFSLQNLRHDRIELAEVPVLFLVLASKDMERGPQPDFKMVTRPTVKASSRCGLLVVRWRERF
jgi:hypothetical protein